jgi:hypothetical protein
MHESIGKNTSWSAPASATGGVLFICDGSFGVTAFINAGSSFVHAHIKKTNESRIKAGFIKNIFYCS